VQHVFERERLEEQFVARVVVGGDGFGIEFTMMVSNPSSLSANAAWTQQ